MAINVNIDSKIFNQIYYPLLDCDKRFQILFGGSSSGKSVFAVGQRPVIDLLRGERNYIICRNVRRTLRHSCFNEVTKFIFQSRLQDLFKISGSMMEITCIPTGKQIYFEGLDNVQKIKSITPRNGPITDIVIEEATETARSDVKELLKRLRGKANVKKRVTMIFNPILRYHWIYEDYFKPIQWADKQRKYIDEKVLILRTTYRDNLRFLEKDDIEELTGESDRYYKDVYTEGYWGILGNLVFENWRIEDLTELLPRFTGHKNGLDFGFTNDPTALSRSVIRPSESKKRKLYITDEIYEKGLTNDVIAERIRPIVNQKHVLCDPAEPKSIWELRNKYGIRALPAWKGPGSINYGIQYLKQFDIIIHKECQNAINEFQLYHFKEGPEGELLNDPVDKYNHFIDATRYAHSREIGKLRKGGTVTNLKKAGIHLPGR